MKLKPIRQYLGGAYPRAAAKGVFLAASLSAASLGGCGPALDSRWVDSAVENGDTDGTVEDCSQADDPAACEEANAGDTGVTP
jgi:hypothetical protein